MSTRLVDLLITNTPPADILRATAARMREQAAAATPGTWGHMCLGSEGCQISNDGKLRDRRHVARFGRKEWKADHADADYVTGMQPAVSLMVARLLDADQGRQGALVQDGVDIARAYMDATGWRPEHEMTGVQR